MTSGGAEVVEMGSSSAVALSDQDTVTLTSMLTRTRMKITSRKRTWKCTMKRRSRWSSPRTTAASRAAARARGSRPGPWAARCPGTSRTRATRTAWCPPHPSCRCPGGTTASRRQSALLRYFKIIFLTCEDYGLDFLYVANCVLCINIQYCIL